MFKNVSVFILVLILGLGAFSGTYAEPTEKQYAYVFGIATVVGVGTAYLVAGQTDNKWAIYGSGIGGALVTCLVADLIWFAVRSDNTHNDGPQNNALKAVEHLQIGSSLDGKTTYAGLHFGF